ncbi:MAG TPA: YraN family protein [Chitinophagaceae bacterium]
MASHNDFGKDAEAMAADWLAGQGYTILHQNWRHSHYEIDIVAVKNETLHIVEVKARNGIGFGYPEEAVTKRKFKHLQKAADEFLYHNPGYQWMQYDVLAITLFNYKEPEYFLLEDVYL